jgi:glycerol-3-phosphate dehydrogenase (NAD(P)+)
MNRQPTSIAILGAGAWGTALAIHLARRQQPVWLWGRDALQVQQMQTTRVNARYLPHTRLPSAVSCTANLNEVLQAAKILLFAVPSRSVLALVDQLKPQLQSARCLILASKGLDLGTQQLLPTRLEALMPSVPYAILSGPSFAYEVAAEKPTALTIASPRRALARLLQIQFHTPRFRVYTTQDVIGASLGGAMKNVLAIAVGISDGLGLGSNAKAALITRGLSEILRVGRVLGAKSKTLMGLAGMGDLILTCTDDQSRNRQLGVAIGQGKRLKEAVESLGKLSEGIGTSQVLYQLAQEKKLVLPICQQVYQILHQGVSPQAAVEQLLNRPAKTEFT